MDKRILYDRRVVVQVLLRRFRKKARLSQRDVAKRLGRHQSFVSKYERGERRLDKEYYYTTTFGSRVADGVYETLLDGIELEELREHEKIEVKHYLMVDGHYTWWDCGRSYLCRIFDMLHMGYVDEVLFGYEVVERLPALVKEWVETERERTKPIQNV
jgi:transcriptional regulator with XRE-family HTH domain